jgi:uncharacterized membrane protein
VSLTGFVAVLGLQANPDLWFHPTGGEKPMAAAYLTAIGRSGTFPPPDPWFSGGVMNYYYGTWYTVAAPARLLGISPDVALNLAVATAASLLVAAAWSIGAALARLGRTSGRPRAVATGLLAVVGVLVVGNLASARQQLERLGDALGGRTAPGFDWWAVSRTNPAPPTSTSSPAGRCCSPTPPAPAVGAGDAHRGRAGRGLRGARPRRRAPPWASPPASVRWRRGRG